MHIASWQFLIFATLAAAAWHAVPGLRWRSAVFLGANLWFCGTMASGVLELLPFLAFFCAGYVAIKIRSRWQSTVVLVFLVASLTLAFCWLKKYLFLEPIGFLQHPYLTVGLSYFLFRLLHLVIDAPDEPLISKIRPLQYANYMLNFTTFVAGPIQRYEDFLRDDAGATPTSVGASLQRIASGFFKVLVTARVLMDSHNLAMTAMLSASTPWQRVCFGAGAVMLYPAFLYFNFAGYTDIMIGTARFFGLRLPENFNRPFLASSFLEFWGRYHMTLSDWFRNYVYSPLLRSAMTRFPYLWLDPVLGIGAFFITFFLMGLWHGSTGMFCVYGLLLAAGASVNELYQMAFVRWAGRRRYQQTVSRGAYEACARGLTYMWYAASMICFWSSPGNALHLLDLLGFVGALGSLALIWLIAALALTIAVRIREALDAWSARREFAIRRARAIWVLALVLICTVVGIVLKTPAPDIVYRAF